jgi:type IV pilus assembly protein PilW
MRIAPRHQRGFTLVELLVASLVALLAISLVTLVFLTQQRSFIALDLTRVASEAGRDALLEMETSLRRLGWGIDPRFAIDFRTYNCAAVPCRDRVDAPDEIVFIARNPNYRWIDNGVGGCATAGGCFTGNAWHASVAGTTVTVTANANDTFTMGRLLLITCTNGARATMARVATTATAAAAGNLAVTVMATVAGSPYRENAWSAVGADPCYATANPPPSVFLVDRFRYAVQDFNGVPWLVLDTGMDLNGNGATAENGADLNDLIPIARGIEDMQIAYAFAPGTAFGFAATDAVNANWIAGDAAGTVEEPDPTLTAPQYATASGDAARYNLHPGNVRAVRVTFGIRSLQTDQSQSAAWTGDPLRLSENRNAQLASFGRLRRYTAATSVTARDMESRSSFIF